MESRSITFTSFDCNVDSLKIKLESLNTTYVIIGKEICPNTMRPHLQCYAQFGKKFTFRKIAKILSCHCEVPKGSVEENIVYCKKGGDYIEIGTVRGISKASSNKDRWKEILDLARKGLIEELETKHPSASILHRKTLLQIRDDNIAAEHHPDRVCLWIWGSSGVGKTRWAFENFKPKDIFILSDTDGWDLYNQERVAILDEADDTLGSSWKRLLRWADRYPVKARRLYGVSALNYEVLIVTSMSDPLSIFNGNAIDAIKRRFIIVHALRYDCERNDLIIEDRNPFPLYLRNYLFKFNLFF